MRLLSAVFVVLVTSLLNSCTDSSSPIEEPGDSKSFILTSVDQDSVYWGDTVIVTFSNAKSNSFTLFLDTISVAIDSAWREDAGTGGIRFLIPVDAISGAIRIFERDSMAKGDRSLVVLPKLRSSFNPKAQYFIPKKAYHGDLLDINGDDLPMRWRDIQVSVDGVPLSIESWTRDHIYARVTPAVKTGELSVRLFNKTTKVGTLDILEHTGSFLAEGHLSKIKVSLREIEGTTHYMQIAQGDTFYTDYEGIQNSGTEVTLDAISPIPSSDSIIYIGEAIEGEYKFSIELRLKPESESRVSGTIRSTFAHPTEDRWGWSEWTVKNVRWVFEDGHYKLYTQASDVTEQVINFTKFVNEYSHTRTWVSYEGGKPTASFTVELTP